MLYIKRGATYTSVDYQSTNDKSLVDYIFLYLLQPLSVDIIFRNDFYLFCFIKACLERFITLPQPQLPPQLTTYNPKPTIHNPHPP